MATISDIEWYRGDSYPQELTITDKTSGDAVDITGYSFIMTVTSVRNPATISEQIFQVVGVLDGDPTTGKVSFTPSTVQTDINPAKYYYDIQMTDDINHVRTIAKFRFTIKQDITKSVASSAEYSISFDDSDLVGNILTVNHNLGDMYPVVTVYDNNSEMVSVTVVPVDENSYTIDFGGAITGTWFVVTRVLASRYTETFTTADLDGSFDLYVTHGLGTAYPAVSVYDNNEELASVTVTSTGTTTFTISFGAAIEGTWHMTSI